MEHPLIGDLSNLSAEELLTRISDLNKKLSIATRSGNNYLCNQLRMAVESHQVKYQEKLRDSYKNNDSNFGNKIDIS
jgi:hypothetical protein